MTHDFSLTHSARSPNYESMAMDSDSTTTIEIPNGLTRYLHYVPKMSYSRPLSTRIIGSSIYAGPSRSRSPVPVSTAETKNILRRRKAQMESLANYREKEAMSLVEAASKMTLEERAFDAEEARRKARFRCRVQHWQTSDPGPSTSRSSLFDTIMEEEDGDDDSSRLSKRKVPSYGSGT